MRNDGMGVLSRGTIITLIAISFIFALAVGSAIFILEETKDDGNKDLVIYAYESFVTYGLAEAVIPAFEELYDVNVSIHTPGDMGVVLSQLELEKGDPKADIVIGVDNSMLHKAVSLNLLEPYTPLNIERLDPTFAFDPDHFIVPFDYGYIAMICNGSMMEERGIPFPTSVLDLANPVYDGQILLLDPAQSSTGSSFMIWAGTVAGEDHQGYFNGLADNANGKMFGSWDVMYALWGEGEAPIAISYGLDTAYEKMWFGTANTVTIVPEDEGYRQIEGAGMVKGANDPDLAKKFLDFILTDTFQEQVYNNYMLPVVPSTPIDPAFQEYGVFAEDHVEPTLPDLEENYEDWMDSWRNAFFGQD